MTDDKSQRPTAALSRDPKVLEQVALVQAASAREFLNDRAKATHATLVEAGHMAALVADKLQQGISKPEDMEAVISVLRKIEAGARQTFTKAGGTDDGYQETGRKVLKRLVTPGGRLRR